MKVLWSEADIRFAVNGNCVLRVPKQRRTVPFNKDFFLDHERGHGW